VTNPAKTLIAALLDRSGSMSTSKQATEDGWRELLNEQRLQPGLCEVTLAQFDTTYELLYPPTPIDNVPDFVLEPRGMTALLDSMGRFITEVGEQLSALPEDDRPGHVICMIMTDGMENSSTEWSWEAVRDLVDRQRDQWNWHVIFLGSNIDAIEVGARMGVAGEASITYDSGHYTSTIAAQGAASSWISSARAGRKGGFTDAQRSAAMGQPRPS
jgi:hypothetical protein